VINLILRELVLTVNNTTASLNEPLQIYRDDRGITLKIKVLKYKYLFDKLIEEDTVKDSSIISARAIIRKPDGVTMFECPRENIEDDCVKIHITRDWTDEDIEIGKYQLQIQLYGSDFVNERITLPPFDFSVVNPIGFVAEPDAPQDVVGYSLADVGAINAIGEATEDNLENNIYNKTNWKTGDIISASRLNKVENALEFLAQERVSGSDVANALASKANVGHTHEEYLTSVPSEYITESELNNKKLVGSNTIKRIEVVSSLPEVEEDDVLYIVR
jgi:hypothetical protein